MIKHTHAKDLVTFSYFLVAPGRGLKFLSYFLLYLEELDFNQNNVKQLFFQIKKLD